MSPLRKARDYAGWVQRTRLAHMACSIARTMDVIGEWWTPLILRDLFAGMSRFEDLRRDLGVASNILTDRLDTLTQRGIVERHQYQTNPPRFEYQLTEKGRDLLPAIVAIQRWGDRWESSAEGPPALLVHDTCDQITTPLVVCDKCHGALSADNVTGIAGPGGRLGPGTAVIGPILNENAIARATRVEDRVHGRGPR
jgi:DNA-binding HxlR family transcriptional regulator